MSDPQHRRRTILAAAERLLEHYGMTKTTVADIAREASIGVGTVYLEFANKDDIIGHVASARHRTVLERLEAAAEAGDDATARLRAVLDARARAFVEVASCGTHAPELMHCRCEPVQDSWREYQAAERALVERLLVQGVDAGEIAVSDPAATALAVLDAYAVFAPPWRQRPDVAGFEARLVAMHELVLRGLRA